MNKENMSDERYLKQPKPSTADRGFSGLRLRNSNIDFEDVCKKKLGSKQIKKVYSKIGFQNMVKSLYRITNKRLSYSFQLLKQFYLFSSESESIEINYKYMRHDLDLGVAKMESTVGIEYRITIGKAFQMIRLCSVKRSIYRSQSNLQHLTSVCQKIRMEGFSRFFARAKELKECGGQISKKKRRITRNSKILKPFQNSYITEFESSGQTYISKFERKSSKRQDRLSSKTTQFNKTFDATIQKFQRMKPARRDSEKTQRRQENEKQKYQESFAQTSSFFFGDKLKQNKQNHKEGKDLIIIQTSRSDWTYEKRIKIPLKNQINVISIHDESAIRRRYSEMQENRRNKRKQVKIIDHSFHQTYGFDRHHPCQFCQYCKTVKEMESYRFKLISKKIQKNNKIQQDFIPMSFKF